MKKRIAIMISVFLTATALSATCVETSTAKSLGISNIVLCASNPKGYMDYEEQPGATFEPGQTVWIYMNLDNVKTNINPDGTKEIWIKLHLKVKAPDGNVLLDQDLYNEHKNFPAKYNMDQLFLRVNLNTVSAMADGRYTVDLKLRDELDKKEASSSTIFTLKQ